jgi:CBS-domain-containing membrane protein
MDPADAVAEAIAHYNLLAIPVVDDENRLQGIVTVDDALDTVAPSACGAGRRGSWTTPSVTRTRMPRTRDGAG